MPIPSKAKSDGPNHAPSPANRASRSGDDAGASPDDGSSSALATAAALPLHGGGAAHGGAQHGGAHSRRSTQSKTSTSNSTAQSAASSTIVSRARSPRRMVSSPLRSSDGKPPRPSPSPPSPSSQLAQVKRFSSLASGRSCRTATSTRHRGVGVRRSWGPLAAPALAQTLRRLPSPFGDTSWIWKGSSSPASGAHSGQLAPA